MINSIKAVRDFAVANYGQDGWDFVVECWSDADIAEAIGKARTAKAAIAKVKAAIAPLAERRDEIMAEADCGAESAANTEADFAALIAELTSAAQSVIDGKAQVAEGKAKGAAALASMVVNFASDTAAAFPWAFTVKVNGDIHHYVECTGTAEFGGTEGAWRYNGQGAISKDAQSAYKRGFQAAFFGMEESNPAVWTMASKAVPMATAIREEGMTATIENGELKLSGGTSERAKAMAEAKSLSALAKVAKGETGTSRATPSNEGGKGEGEDARIATPAEIMALAARLVEGVAKGEEALGNVALSYVRKIAALVAANPDAFAED